MSAPRVHPRYYVNDELTVFLVNNEILFKVHRHALDRESEKFRALPTGTDENPVPLNDVKEDEFVTLLEYFYDSVHGDTPKPFEEWARLLSISHQFGMGKIYDRAVKELNLIHLDPVDRVVLAVKHSIPGWLSPAYVNLCVRHEPLSEDEALKLGLSTTVKLARARERFRAKPSTPLVSRQPVPSGGSFGSSFQLERYPVPQEVGFHCNDMKEDKCGDWSPEEDMNLARSIIAEIFFPRPKSPPSPHPIFSFDDRKETVDIDIVAERGLGNTKKGKNRKK